MSLPASGRADQEAADQEAADQEAGARRGLSVSAVVWTLVGSMIVGVCVFGFYRALFGKDPPAPAPAAATDLGAIPIGSNDARIRVDVYIDMHCADCQTWEAGAAPILDEAVSSGRARVVYHPVAFLARNSSTRYSTRAAAAAGCASESGAYVAYQRLLFANHPPPLGEGLPEQRLIELGRQVGAGEPFAACVREGRFEPWVTAMTTRAYNLGVRVTPTILVDGDRIAATDTALREALAPKR